MPLTQHLPDSFPTPHPACSSALCAGRAAAAPCVHPTHPSCSGPQLNPPQPLILRLLLLQQRFVLDERHQPLRIRAAQGHSITLADPQLSPVTDTAAVPAAVHATSQGAWQAIQSSGELRRMSRSGEV